MTIKRFHSKIHETVEKIKTLILFSDIKIVSFDIFDTLIVRDCLYPDNIFRLIDSSTLSIDKNSLYEARKNAEKEINDRYVSFNLIWKNIQRKLHIDKESIEKLKESEIAIERELSRRRDLIFELYLLAANRGKKIIAVSDMYLPSDIIYDFLEDAGYKYISVIYVSNECKARKSEGDLFEYVLKKEGIKPNEMIHIGDNYLSDYIVPNKMRVQSFYIPSNFELFKNSIKLNCDMEIDSVKSNFLLCLIFGHAINTHYSNKEYVFYDQVTKDYFSDFVLFPILATILINLIKILNLNHVYKKIYFAARDGYLPFKIYKRYIEGAFTKAEGVYFEASRRAYSSTAFKSIYDQVLKDKIPKNCTLEDFIETLIIDSELAKGLMSVLSGDERTIRIIDERERIIDILRSKLPEINELWSSQSIVTKEYYRNIFSEEQDRCIVFDCGYSGSISIGLSASIENRLLFDKFYLWQSDKNREFDRSNGTTSFVMFDDNRPSWMDCLIETFLSPLAGSCIGFKKIDSEIIAIHEDVSFSSDMVELINSVQQGAEIIFSSFVRTYHDCISNIEIEDCSLIIRLCEELFRRQNENIFDNIIFNDSNYSHNVVIRMSDLIRSRNKITYASKPRKTWRKVKNLWKKLGIIH